MVYGFQATQVGADGSALLVWHRGGKVGGALTMRASALGAGATVWDAPATVQDDVAFESSYGYYGLPIAINGRGDGAIAAVSNAGGLWLSTFDGAQRKWGVPRLVASVTAVEVQSYVHPIQVALADDGSAVVAWQAANHIWASHCR